MKRFFRLVLLGLFVWGFYHLYTTNEGFNNFVSGLFSGKENSGGGHSNPPSTHSGRTPLRQLRPGPFEAIDERARNTPAEYEKDPVVLARYLTQNAANDTEKARAIFTWVATHIAYDAEGFASGSYKNKNYSAKDVLSKRTSVCEGYSDLTQALLQAVGLECVKIGGKSKGYSYSTTGKLGDHAWNAVKIDGVWRFLETTWAAGYVSEQNGKLVFTPKFKPYWFDTPANEFLFSHFPDQSKWQLTSPPITLQQFEKLPDVDESIFELGFNAKEIMQEGLSGSISELAQTYTPDFPVKILKAPREKRLKANAEVQFGIESEYAEGAALVIDKQWNYFKNTQGDVFTLSCKPSAGKALLCVKFAGGDRYKTIAQYAIQ